MADRTKVTGVLFFIGTIAIVAAGLLLQVSALGRWLVILALMVLILVDVGVGVTSHWWGVLIDDRNKLSLSRLQLVLWTLLVLSAFLAAVLVRLAANTPDPLHVPIPEPLWWLMGISTTSLVGTPLIRTTKTKLAPLPSERDETLRLVAAGTPAGNQAARETRGLIVQNATPDGARWTDLFMGEETGNAAQPDMGKIQMFYFTVILVIAYALTIAHQFQSASPPDQLPAVEGSMLALLGISHAAYLVNKGVPHSRVSP